MIGRPATRIDLKIEEDLSEYDEFKLRWVEQKNQERMQSVNSAFRSHSPKGPIPTGFESVWYDNSNSAGGHGSQIPGYNNYQFTYGSNDSRQIGGVGLSGAPQQRKKRSNVIGTATQGYGNQGNGMNDDSMNDSF